MTSDIEPTGALWRQVIAEQQPIIAAQVLSLPVADIDASDRLRGIDQSWVAILMDSIRARVARGLPALEQPVTVRPKPEGGHKLVVGGHRFAAVSGVGHLQIDAIVRQFSDLEARLAEVDENLCRRELSALDRAAFLAERKRLYEELYPQAKRGKKGALARWHDASGNLPLAFTEHAAKATGLDVSVVRKVLKTFEALAPATRARIAGTWLANNDSQLKALSKCGPDLQGKVLDVLLRAEGPAPNIAAALAEVENRQATVVPPDEMAFAALVRAWDRAESFPKARERFLAHAGLQAAPKTPKRKAQKEPEAA